MVNKQEGCEMYPHPQPCWCGRLEALGLDNQQAAEVCGMIRAAEARGRRAALDEMHRWCAIALDRMVTP